KEEILPPHLQAPRFPSCPLSLVTYVLKTRKTEVYGGSDHHSKLHHRARHPALHGSASRRIAFVVHRRAARAQLCPPPRRPRFPTAAPSHPPTSALRRSASHKTPAPWRARGGRLQRRRRSPPLHFRSGRPRARSGRFTSIMH